MASKRYSVNLIHARAKPDPGFQPSSRERCFKCMEAGTHYVFIRGSRKYACVTHFREWQEFCNRSERNRDHVLNEE